MHNIFGYEGIGIDPTKCGWIELHGVVACIIEEGLEI
jgi:hypothetical protein